MDFPCAVVAGNAPPIIFTVPVAFVGPDGVQHSAAVWGLWSADDWAEKCPGWTVLPVIDAPPAPDLEKVIERLPDTEWAVTADAVTVTYRVTDRSPTEVAALFVQAQADAVERVNKEAGQARARFITVAVGQEGTYLEKAAEAVAFETDSAPSADKYPYLYEEAAATDTPVADVAALINLTAQAWRPINAKIEGLRQGALKAIRDATTIDQVQAAFPIAWPTPA